MLKCLCWSPDKSNVNSMHAIRCCLKDATHELPPLYRISKLLIKLVIFSNVVVIVIFVFVYSKHALTNFKLNDIAKFKFKNPIL